MNVVLRGVRVIDPLSGVDRSDQDVWFRDGRLMAYDPRRIQASGAWVIDLHPMPWILCPAFIDLHVHLRVPGETGKETLTSGAQAAAAGGFGHVVAMANTRPVLDEPSRISRVLAEAEPLSVRVLQAGAVTRGLRGAVLADLHACAGAGAPCFSDDGRNAMSGELLRAALRTAADLGRAVMIHPEDERGIASANPGMRSVSHAPHRPRECEVSAVKTALQAMEEAGRGRLHLQHVSVSGSISALRQAREKGLPVTAEVTPHHLAMWLPMEQEPDPPALRKTNPPLRGQRDREAMIQALRDGVVDAVATDHAPHHAGDKQADYDASAPGMIGLETALGTCITMGGMGGDWIPVLIERLTAGPWRVLGESVGLRRPVLKLGELATCTLFDPTAEWRVGDEPLHSHARNTPLIGMWLQGRVALTMVDGRVAYLDRKAPVFGLAEAFSDN